MARTIAQIQAQIILSVQADSTLAQINSPSAFAIWRLWTYVVASAIWLLETYFDIHKAEVNEALATLKPHRLRWYQAKTLAFQYGSDLVKDEDYYNNSALTPDEIADQQIVAQASVTEADGKVTVKAAKEVADELEPLETAEYNSLLAYLQEIKDAGVRLELLSFNADKLKLTIDVYYDPLILNADGERIDGTNDDPVGEAARLFLREGLTFNGLFVVEKLRDALQGVDGVFVPMIRSVSAARYDNPSLSGVDVVYQPYSGFLRFYDAGDLTLNFIEKNLA